MKTRELNLDQKVTERYIAPNFVVVDIIIDQNILNNSSGDVGLQNMPGENW